MGTCVHLAGTPGDAAEPCAADFGGAALLCDSAEAETRRTTMATRLPGRFMISSLGVASLRRSGTGFRRGGLARRSASRLRSLNHRDGAVALHKNLVGDAADIFFRDLIE